MIIMKFERKVIRNEKKVLVNGVQTPLIASGSLQERKLLGI